MNGVSSNNKPGILPVKKQRQLPHHHSSSRNFRSHPYRRCYHHCNNRRSSNSSDNKHQRWYRGTPILPPPPSSLKYPIQNNQQYTTPTLGELNITLMDHTSTTTPSSSKDDDNSCSSSGNDVADGCGGGGSVSGTGIITNDKTAATDNWIIDDNTFISPSKLSLFEPTFTMTTGIGVSGYDEYPNDVYDDSCDDSLLLSSTNEFGGTTYYYYTKEGKEVSSDDIDQGIAEAFIKFED